MSCNVTAGASSCAGNIRRKNACVLSEYIEGIISGKPACEYTETLTGEQIFMETLMLGLRKTDGFSPDALSLSVSDKEAFLRRVFSMPELLVYDKGILKCTPRGLEILEYVLQKLIS